MTNPIVECVPNFSEARRQDVVDAIVNTIQSTKGAHVIDRSSDTDHNRSVITIAGDPSSVEEAAFNAIKTASMLIDLNQHTGEHPRIGATDVVPFVPIKDVTMQECIDIAHRLGKRVGEELNIPIYLYEEASLRSDRKNLEDIRRGQFEGLKEGIKTDPYRTPDFGPSELGPAGATVIGARNPLIAFNAYLSTPDVTIARKVAKAIRHSSGGLRYVKALGLLVNGLAQVSMNLTNYKATPIPRVLEAIRSEAGRYGTTIHHCELVGLIPEDALIDTAVWFSQLDSFTNDQILEQRLSSCLAQTEETDIEQESFIDDLASSSPTPGGGAAAAYVGALAAALAAMVARLTRQKKKYQAVHPLMDEYILTADDIRRQLLQLVELDSKAYDQVMVANRLSKNTPEEVDLRNKAYQKALLNAAQIPLQVARKSLEVWNMSVDLAEQGAIAALSDIGSAAALSRACFTCAHMNVQTNLTGLEDQQAVKYLTNEISILENKKIDLESKFASILAERNNLRFI